MGTATSRLTILFEEPFWIGIYEREDNGRVEVCKLTFGAEPKDYQVYDFMLIHWDNLRFSPTMEVAKREEKCTNPKRLQRQIQKQVQQTGIGTKAQQALKLQQEQGKLARTECSRKARLAEKQKQFDLRQQKRKEKHRGH